MDDIVSPEEKLLRLIRKKDEDKKSQAGKGELSKNTLRFANGLAADVSAGIFSVLEKVFLLGILGILGYLFYDSYYIRKDIRNFMADNESHAAQVEWKQITTSEAKPFSYY